MPVINVVCLCFHCEYDSNAVGLGLGDADFNEECRIVQSGSLHLQISPIALPFGQT